MVCNNFQAALPSSALPIRIRFSYGVWSLEVRRGRVSEIRNQKSEIRISNSNISALVDRHMAK